MPIRTRTQSHECNEPCPRLERTPRRRRGRRGPCEPQDSQRILGQRGEEWEADCLRLISEQLGAAVYEVNFADDPEASRKIINEWVEEKQRIQELLQSSPLSKKRSQFSQCRLFQSALMMPFEEANTKTKTLLSWMAKRSAYPPDGLHSGRQRVKAGLQQLPFRSGQLAMVFIVPDGGEFKPLKMT